MLDATELDDFELDELDKLELVTEGLDELTLELLLLLLTELVDEELLDAVPSIRNQLTLKPPATALIPNV